MRDHEVVLPRRVVRQPKPHVNPGGDCGACVLAGLLGTEVGDVYERFRGGKCESFHWHAMRTALWEARSAGLVDRIVTDVPMWPANVPDMAAAWGWHSGYQSLAWASYVEMAVDAGYYGIAMVDVHKKGAHGGGTNHWVMLCGSRERTEPMSDGAAEIKNEVLVSCSSSTTPDEEWVGVQDFLRERGGFNVLLVRPT